MTIAKRIGVIYLTAFIAAGSAACASKRITSFEAPVANVPPCGDRKLTTLKQGDKEIGASLSDLHYDATCVEAQAKVQMSVAEKQVELQRISTAAELLTFTYKNAKTSSERAEIYRGIMINLQSADPDVRNAQAAANKKAGLDTCTQNPANKAEFICQ